MKPYYADDSVTLYHGDCRDVLPQLDIRVDCVIADPPYESTSLKWDRWPAGWLDAVARVADSMWCWLPVRQFATPPFRGLEFAAAGWKLSQDVEGEWDHLAWEKHNGSGFAKDRFKGVHEIATHWYRGPWSEVRHEVPTTADATPRQVRRKTRPTHTGHIEQSHYVSEDGGPRLMRSVLRVRSMHGKAIHPTEKPPGVLVPQIEYACPPGGLVLDPTAGSCSTGVAARLAGRRAVLIEADEAMCEKAVVHRLAQDVLPLEVS